jgi:hypothetical protein
MAPLPPVDDTYIDTLIRSSGPSNPAINRTQGADLRLLLKVLRNYLLQEISTGDSGKVDKAAGYGLSQENFTPAEKNKLANLSEHYKGTYVTFAALVTANATGIPGDYAFVDAGPDIDAKMHIWDGDGQQWVQSSGGITPDATEGNAGIVALATLAQALARTNDTKAMTALKTIALILDEKKNVDRQIAPVGVTEVSFLMKNSGVVNSVMIAGATNPKLKIGPGGAYPTGTQTYPFAYSSGDRLFVTYNYSDLNTPSCNLILTCKDN